MKILQQTLINIILLLIVKISKKIRYEMTSGECFENKLFYKKYIRKYPSVERPLTCECICNVKSSTYTSILKFSKNREVKH